ncbi:ABC transporter ATP-binding protein (plasmid) [Mesorhizobium sp. B2-1-8]|uniref:ABC transporter ATP-binding protein n=1 Tax=Mesorhizobium sp. B2-1-8 TaxID=2589967 RepID=UPI001125D50C|nr:ABC transporter ATP-binding protein [Mesorhizobium sp. B2-1-8]UCI22763.1 ABC transporter ATP-binding protein [Mesorhizobium sp. B2-1-8]
MDGTLLEYRGISKSHDGSTMAVRDIDLRVRRGEFLTLLGPSGSGKSTLLMMTAGFDEPTRGEIFYDGASMRNVSPGRRNMGVIFQSYALFPHMTVAQNIAFPLRVRGNAKEEIRRRIERQLALVHLSGYGDRKPGQLSGGQQQRVALARALVFSPNLVLMDEPLSALDKKLREHMQVEIKRIQQETGVTVLFVTHDQGEALAMSDRIAVFNAGRLEQVGTPEEIYRNPATEFVSTFIGSNGTTQGTVRERRGDRYVVQIHGGEQIEVRDNSHIETGSRVKVMVRPEDVMLGNEETVNRLTAVVDGISFQGDHYKVQLRVGNSDILYGKVSPEDRGRVAFGKNVPIAISREVRMFRHD